MEQVVVFIRHGKPENEGYADERLRPLSPEGATATRRVLTQLKEMGYPPNRVYSSPLLRAQQTASEVGMGIKTMKALGYDFDGQALLDVIRAEGSEVSYCFGHMPSLADFVNSICDEIVLPRGLRTSEAALVSVQSDRVKFLALVSP